MKNPRLLFAFAVILLAAPLYSVDIEIEYLDGYLDVQEGGEWYELLIGDVITDVDGLVGAQMVEGLCPQYHLGILADVFAVELGQQQRPLDRDRGLGVARRG